MTRLPRGPLDPADEVLYLLDRYGHGSAWNAAVLVVEGMLDSADVRAVLDECSSRLLRMESSIRAPLMGVGRSQWAGSRSPIDLEVLDVSCRSLTTGLLSALVTLHYGRAQGGRLCSATLMRTPRADRSVILLQTHHSVGDGATLRSVVQEVLSSRTNSRTRRYHRVDADLPPEPPSHGSAPSLRDGVELVKQWRGSSKRTQSPIPTRPSGARAVYVSSAGRRAWGAAAQAAGGGGHELALFVLARALQHYSGLRYPQLKLPDVVRIAVPFVDSRRAGGANNIVVKVADVSVPPDSNPSLPPIRKVLDELHRESLGAVSSASGRMLMRLPPRLRALATSSLWNSMADAGLTSGQVPGKYSIKAHRVQSIYVAPMALGVPVNVSKQLYGNHVSFGLTIDTKRIDAPELFAHCFESVIIDALDGAGSRAEA